MRLTVAMLLIIPALVVGQRPARSLPEPILFDTPWGDFPLERAQPGARLRLISAGGETVVRIVRIADSTVDVQSVNGDSLPPLTFAQLRGLRAVEVKSVPAWHDRASRWGLVLGGAIGVIAGVRRNAHRARSDRGATSGLLEDLGGEMSIYGLIGWEAGGIVIGRPRWRRVTVP